MMQRLLFLLTFCAGLGFASPTAQAGARGAQRPGNGDERTLVVFPNPSTGIVHLSINGLEGRKVEIQILNVIGTVMYRETLTELNERYTKTLDLGKFANGLYYVKLEADNTSQMCKLVIR